LRPGTAIALAVSLNASVLGMENILASGGYAATSARLAGDGTCRWKENATTAARSPAGA
jgi:hypothetical protein